MEDQENLYPKTREYSDSGPEAAVEDDFERRDDLLPIVGLGGSAGSIPTLQQFFEALPPKTGMAYVVVVHLSPEHDSLLGDIIQRSTSMPVHQVTGAMTIEVDHVYVISPGMNLTMVDGVVEATEMTRPRGRHVAVDMFFRTLAETHGPGATAIVLSGGDSDGAIGLKHVKEHGGLTIAQDPGEAEHAGMPRSAIATGMVDWILPVKEIPGRLIEFQENGKKIQLPPESPPVPATEAAAKQQRDETALREVLSFLKARAGHDFSYYKRATILRRIGRRMQVNGTADLEAYLAFLRTHSGESGALLQDLLISVTNFFRDKEAFGALEGIIPELFKNKTSLDQVRVWVPACATGEEAYSIAILLSEFAAKVPSPPQIQVFATDLDQSAIEVAREGRYPLTIAADVSEDRLRQFFRHAPDGYRVRRPVRELVLFALHDLLKDSPFSRLDLISCRNLLIYFNREAQSRVFDIFHFALGPAGKLFLGSSESGEEAAPLFSQIDKKYRMYARRAVPRVGLIVPAGAATLSYSLRQKGIIPRLRTENGASHELQPIALPEQPAGASWADLHFKLIDRIAPPSLVIDRDYEIVHLSKSAGKYLRFIGGEPTMNLLRVIHPQLRTDLRAALFQATKPKESVRINNIQVEIDGVVERVDILVEHFEGLDPDLLLVVFQEHKSIAEKPDETMGKAQITAEEAGVIQHLEEELDHLRTNWRETIEQYEASTEELKASNEELQAMNEELRSATEELETGREELQSINEEIITINQELKGKVDELSRANSDLQNLMASTKIATIFLDRELQISRFTPSSTGLFNFIGTDIGRPLSDLTHRLEYPEISADAEKVLENLAFIEREVRDLDGRWFLARMGPYRTTEDVIAGVVITCVDITERKQAEEARRWLSAVVESSNDAIISFTLDDKIVSWNQGAERVFGYGAQEMKGRPQSVMVPPAMLVEMPAMFEKLRRGEAIDQFETVRVRKDGQLIDVSLSASTMKDEFGKIVGATAIVQDITVRKRAIEDLRQARDELEARVSERTEELSRRVKQLRHMASELTITEQRERRRMAHVLHDELQQLLVAAKMRVESLETVETADRNELAGTLVPLLDEALSKARSLAVDLSPPILAEGLGKALEWLCGTWMREKYNLFVHCCDIDTSLDCRHQDMRVLVFLAVRELLFNVVKHSTVSEATVELKAVEGGNLQVVVKDGGRGFDASKLDDKNCGTGFGLISLHERLELLGGSLEISSIPGNGVMAVILAPMNPSQTTRANPQPITS